MIAATSAELKRAKIKFFAVYAASVLLIVIILASLWKGRSSMNEASATPTSVSDGDKFVAADALLHTGMEQLDNRYTTLLTGNRQMLEENLKSIQEAEVSFKTTLDSMEKGTGSLRDEQQKREMDRVVVSFKKAFQSKAAIMKSYVELLKDPSHPSTLVLQNNPNDPALQELKGILVEKEQKISALELQRQNELSEKDKTIAALQSQLKQFQDGKAVVSAVPQNSSGDQTEWKQKYAKIKAGYDNLVSQNNALNNANKTITDDNRRLLTQLQSIRATKN